MPAGRFRTKVVLENFVALSEPTFSDDFCISDCCVSNKQLQKQFDCSGGCMYDLSWCENHADGQFKGQLKSVPLILESEWNSSWDYIKYDFEKLLMGRAKYKIMIFQGSGEQKDQNFKKMESGIEAFAGGSIGDSAIWYPL